MHVAFSIDEEDFQKWIQWLKENQVNIFKKGDQETLKTKVDIFHRSGWHKIELHTGTLKIEWNIIKVRHICNFTMSFDILIDM